MLKEWWWVLTTVLCVLVTAEVTALWCLWFSSLDVRCTPFKKFCTICPRSLFTRAIPMNELRVKPAILMWGHQEPLYCSETAKPAAVERELETAGILSDVSGPLRVWARVKTCISSQVSWSLYSVLCSVLKWLLMTMQPILCVGSPKGWQRT